MGHHQPSFLRRHHRGRGEGGGGDRHDRIARTFSRRRAGSPSRTWRRRTATSNFASKSTGRRRSTRGSASRFSTTPGTPASVGLEPGPAKGPSLFPPPPLPPPPERRRTSAGEHYAASPRSPARHVCRTSCRIVRARTPYAVRTRLTCRRRARLPLAPAATRLPEGRPSCKPVPNAERATGTGGRSSFFPRSLLPDSGHGAAARRRGPPRRAGRRAATRTPTRPGAAGFPAIPPGPVSRFAVSRVFLSLVTSPVLSSPRAGGAGRRGAVFDPPSRGTSGWRGRVARLVASDWPASATCALAATASERPGCRRTASRGPR